MHHPGFVDISVDRSLLLRLPENDTVFNDLTTMETADTGIASPHGPSGRDDDDDDNDAGFATGTVPNTRPTRTEAEDLRAGTQVRYSFSQCALHFETERSTYIHTLRKNPEFVDIFNVL